MPKLYEYFGLIRVEQAHRAGTHHPEVEMNQPDINILNAEPDGDYRLRLRFDDGAIQTVDFLPFLSRSHHPDIRAFLDPKRFASFHLEFGELVWGDFDLCFPVMDLYHDRILLKVPDEEAA